MLRLECPHCCGLSIIGLWLAEAYGDRAKQVTRIAEDQKLGRRLVRGHPVIEAEVVYCIRNEMCETPEDFIARRTRLAFIDTAATAQALPRVSILLAGVAAACLPSRRRLCTRPQSWQWVA